MVIYFIAEDAGEDAGGFGSCYAICATEYGGAVVSCITADKTCTCGEGGVASDIMGNHSVVGEGGYGIGYDFFFESGTDHRHSEEVTAADSFFRHKHERTVLVFSVHKSHFRHFHNGLHFLNAKGIEYVI